MFKIGDEGYVDTSLPHGWPDGEGKSAIYNTGIREATIIDVGGRLGFLVDGVMCSPSGPKVLITGRIVRQLEND